MSGSDSNSSIPRRIVRGVIECLFGSKQQKQQHQQQQPQQQQEQQQGQQQSQSSSLSTFSQLPGVMDVGPLHIQDHNVLSYINLLEEAKAESVNIDIRGNPSHLPGMREVIAAVARHKTKVDRLDFDYLFRHPSQDTPQMETLVNQLMERCSIVYYTGRMKPDLQIPKSLRWLYVSVDDTPSYLQLQSFLTTKHVLHRLDISVNIWQVEVDKLTPLPGDNMYTQLYLPDVGGGKGKGGLPTTENDLQIASEIAKRLNPIDGYKKFGWILFPRLTLDGDEIKSLLSLLKGVNLLGSVVFPSSSKPSSSSAVDEMHELCRSTLHGNGIQWGKPNWADQGGIANMDSW